jgi:3-isopropylmalate dehydrogenase
MLLEWLGRRHKSEALSKAGHKIDAAIDAALRNPATRTRDLGGTLGTQAFAAVVAGNLS